MYHSIFCYLTLKKKSIKLLVYWLEYHHRQNWMNLKRIILSQYPCIQLLLSHCMFYNIVCPIHQLFVLLNPLSVICNFTVKSQHNSHSRNFCILLQILKHLTFGASKLHAPISTRDIPLTKMIIIKNHFLNFSNTHKHFSTSTLNFTKIL